MKRLLHIILSVWLAVVLFFGSTPKEFIHLFADHVDTVHSIHEKDGLVIEAEHHHCNFLSYALPLFLNDDQQVTFSFHKPIVFPDYRSAVAVRFTKATVRTAYLRGPPVA